jgi:prepilin-type N-terminal cleavage/methylation domain-containing protein/prepilin-type processing-associated H-X9-DG protein
MKGAPKARSGSARVVSSGFSLVELIVVLAIITVLVGVGVPAMSRVRQSAKKLECQNHLRNIALGLIQFDHYRKRFPASGSFLHDEDLFPHPHQNWAVAILPYVDQENVHALWEADKPLTDPANLALTRASIPVYVCPVDLSRNKERQGDLSYAVNGGVGFTVRHVNGVRDCPVDAGLFPLDLNGDGSACAGAPADDADRDLFKRLGLFFLETSNTDVTKRHHTLGDITDGASQTFLVTENVRTGYSPNSAQANFTNPAPRHCAFYIGNPCVDGRCASGNVDYSRCNAGASRINSGLWSEEGKSAVPNSFHAGGVNMAYADCRVAFLSESIDGGVYAALASPQGGALHETPLGQPVVGDGY